MRLDLNLPERKVGFDIGYDPDFASDVNMRICIDKLGAPEPEVVHAMSRCLREGDHAIDVGANVGFFTLLMSQIVGKTGKVTAFEPAPNNLRKLYENLGANEISSQIEVHLQLS